MLRLETGPLAVDLAPEAGGSIARFSVEAAGRAFDLMRPAEPESLAAGRGSGTSSYPLVPYSGRIAEGRFTVGGRAIVLAPNWPGQRHPMHGDGWAHPWIVDRSTATTADLVYAHDGRTGWPFRYVARQSFRLTSEALTVALSVESRDSEPMPVGIGLHPFFTREPDTTLACAVGRVWLTDAEIMPTTRAEVPREWSFSSARRVDKVALDNCFEGWDRRATIAWPGRGLRLDIEASEVFGHVVIYIPPGRPYFCVEPVTHANNAFALHPLGVEDIGYRLLGHGERLSGEVVFRIGRS
jgi:aldose 1-epimerase